MVDTKEPDSLLEAYAVGRKALTVSLETLAVVKLELFFHDVHLSSATGFIYRYADNYILATNLHVLNGVNPNTGKIMDRRAFVPNKIDFYINLFGDEFGSFKITPFSADIVIDGTPVWYESNVDAPGIDVAMIELAEIINDFEQLKRRVIYLRGGRMLVKCDEDGQPSFVYHAYPRVGSDVYILGFPRGVGQGAFPIWKKGSIATEPVYGVAKSPIILVDAATREGMSGSPVLYYGTEVVGDYGPGDLSQVPDSEGPLVVGVYAGREGVTDQENSMALGRVWKIEVLESIFGDKDRRRGKYLGIKI